MELVDRGYLSEEEIGRSLKWGDAEALVELTRMTGEREGFGDLLAEGSYRFRRPVHLLRGPEPGLQRFRGGPGWYFGISECRHRCRLHP